MATVMLMSVDNTLFTDAIRRQASVPVIVSSAAFVFFGALIIHLSEVDTLPRVGPYSIIVTSLEKCEDEGTLQLNYSLKINKVGRDKFLFNTESYFKIPFDEDIVIKIEVQQWGNQGYRPRSIMHTAKGCREAWMMMSTFIIQYMKSAGVDLKKCPIPAGNFTPNVEVKIQINNILVLEYNKYRGFFEFYKDERKVGCFKAYAKVIPKSLFD